MRKKGEIQKELEWQYLGLRIRTKEYIALCAHKVILFIRSNNEEVYGSARMRELKYISLFLLYEFSNNLNHF